MQPTMMHWKYRGIVQKVFVRNRPNQPNTFSLCSFLLSISFTIKRIVGVSIFFLSSVSAEMAWHSSWWSFHSSFYAITKIHWKKWHHWKHNNHHKECLRMTTEVCICPSTAWNNRRAESEPGTRSRSTKLLDKPSTSSGCRRRSSGRSSIQPKSCWA